MITIHTQDRIALQIEPHRDGHVFLRLAEEDGTVISGVGLDDAQVKVLQAALAARYTAPTTHEPGGE